MSNTSQASQRITALLDENSFVEIGAKVTARATDFNLKQTKPFRRCDHRLRGDRWQPCVCVQPGCFCFGEALARCTPEKLQAFMTWQVRQVRR